MHQTKRLLMDKTSLSLLIFLLLLRFPLLVLSQFGLINNTLSLVMFLLGTYLCTGVFICRNITNLDQYCITTPAVIIFLLSPVGALLYNATDPTAFARIVMAALFALYIFRKRHNLHAVKNDVKTMIPNSLFVIVCVIVTTFLFAYIRGFSGSDSSVTPSMLINSLMFQLSYAAVMEEPLFRGFLWGSFRQLGLTEIWICALQAVLFWLGHIYYFNTGLNFWVVIPMGSLVLGFIIMKTKSIAYSMVTHSLMNSLGDIFQHFIRLI